LTTRAAPPPLLAVRRNCLDDGPGIRTAVFFKGCPLACVWCHNPESRDVRAELSIDPDECLGCDACAAICPEQAASRGAVDRARCRLCFACASACPAGARQRLGEPAALDAILATLEKDLPFFRTSGGGLTLSGGEPTLYPDFCAELLQGARRLGVRTLLETCGLFAYERFAGTMLPWLDEIFIDVKIAADAAHRLHCGASNQPILANLHRLAVAAANGGPAVLPRVPLIPGLTDTDENLSAIAQLLREIGFARVALLPYNPTWAKKARMLGKEPRFAVDRWQTADELARCRRQFAGFAVEGA
jgi:pyruvate formate lyase activating enzyme